MKYLPALALLLVATALAVLARPVRAADAAAPDLVPRIAAATDAFRAAADAASPQEREAAFRHAAELHERALADGHRNGALEYNAANAWLLAGDVGRAVLHYRRALEIRPGDPRVEANLATARSRRRDQFDVTSSRALVDTLLFWHRGLSLRGKIPLALGAWAVGFLLLAGGVWLPRGRAGRTGTLRVGAVALLVAVAVGVSALVELRERSAHDAAVVVGAEATLRTGDGASYPARYENPIHAGAEVRVVEERAGWLDVELPDGKRGWVPAEAVERV